MRDSHPSLLPEGRFFKSLPEYQDWNESRKLSVAMSSDKGKLELVNIPMKLCYHHSWFALNVGCGSGWGCLWMCGRINSFLIFDTPHLFPWYDCNDRLLFAIIECLYLPSAIGDSPFCWQAGLHTSASFSLTRFLYLSTILPFKNVYITRSL